QLEQKETGWSNVSTETEGNQHTMGIQAMSRTGRGMGLGTCRQSTDNRGAPSAAAVKLTLPRQPWGNEEEGHHTDTSGPTRTGVVYCNDMADSDKSEPEPSNDV